MNSYVIELDLDKLSKAFCLEKSNLQEAFKDARVVSRFTELYASKLYNFDKCSNTNEKDKDGILENKLENLNISIRCLNEKIMFQASRYIGSGRSCTKEDLINSVNNDDFYIVVDISEFPKLIFYPFKTKVLIEAINENIITKSGITRKKFYSKLIPKIEPIKYTKMDIYKEWINEILLSLKKEKEKYMDENKPQIQHLPDGQLNLPENAIPLIVLFYIPSDANPQEAKIGIIVNEKANPVLVQQSLDHAQKVVKSKALQPGALAQSGQQQQHPKLTDILGS